MPTMTVNPYKLYLSISRSSAYLSAFLFELLLQSYSWNISFDDMHDKNLLRATSINKYNIFYQINIFIQLYTFF